MAMSNWLEDVRYALRALTARPVYALASIAVLAIAIGANTTVFSVFNGLFLRPLPYPDGDRLVMVYDSYPKMDMPNAGTSIPDYLDRREQAPSLESLAIFAEHAAHARRRRTAAARCSSRARRRRCSKCCASRRPLGRAFTADEETLGNERVAVLSYGLWSTRFGARPDIVGSDIRLDGDSFRVDRRHAGGVRVPEPRHRRIRAVRVHAGADERCRARQSVLEQRRAAAPGATVEGLNAELDGDRAAQRRGGPRAGRRRHGGRIHGPRRSRCATSGRQSQGRCSSCSRRS